MLTLLITTVISGIGLGAPSLSTEVVTTMGPCTSQFSDAGRSWLWTLTCWQRKRVRWQYRERLHLPQHVQLFASNDHLIVVRHATIAPGVFISAYHLKTGSYQWQHVVMPVGPRANKPWSVYANQPIARLEKWNYALKVQAPAVPTGRAWIS